MSETLDDLLALQKKTKDELTVLKGKIKARQQADEEARNRLSGRVLLAKLDAGFDGYISQEIVREWLAESLTKNRDRALFDLPLLPAKKRERSKKSKPSSKLQANAQTAQTEANNLEANPHIEVEAQAEVASQSEDEWIAVPISGVAVLLFTHLDVHCEGNSPDFPQLPLLVQTRNSSGDEGS